MRRQEISMHFPAASGKNLNRKSFELPSDFEGDHNLVIIAFYRDQQRLVDTWVPSLNELERRYNNFRYYELPTISLGYLWMRGIIDGGMRAGIQNDRTRNRTITLYLSKTIFKKALKVEDENMIYLFLVTRAGEILWNGSGGFEDSEFQSIKKKLKELNSG